MFVLERDKIIKPLYGENGYEIIGYETIGYKEALYSEGNCPKNSDWFLKNECGDDPQCLLCKRHLSFLASSMILNSKKAKKADGFSPDDKSQAIEALKSAYKKHVLRTDDIGADELGNVLAESLCELLGDDGFQEWLDVECEAE